MKILKIIVSIGVSLIAGYVIPFALLLFGFSLGGDFRVTDPDGYLYLAVLALSVAIFIFTIVRFKIYGYSFLALFIGFCVFLTLVYP